MIAAEDELAKLRRERDGLKADLDDANNEIESLKCELNQAEAFPDPHDLTIGKTLELHCRPWRAVPRSATSWDVLDGLGYTVAARVSGPVAELLVSAVAP
jgi:hypothetical protein